MQISRQDVERARPGGSLVRNPLRGLLVGLLLLSSWSLAHAGGNAELSIFNRWLGSDIWSSGSSQLGIGLNLDMGRKGWPVHIAGGYSYSSFSNSCGDGGFFLCFEPQFRFRTKLSEWRIGIAKTWRPAMKARPYLTGGAAFVFSSIVEEESGLDSSDRTQGLYLSTGVRWGPRGPSARPQQGFELRMLTGTGFDVAGTDADADYFLIGYVVGGGW